MIEKILALFEMLPADKAKHAIYGALLFAVAHLLLGDKSAIIAVLISAISKEIYDRFHSTIHTPDPYDSIATMSGGAIGWICTLSTLNLWRLI